MRRLLTILALALSIADCKAKGPEPFKTIDLNKRSPNLSECDGRWVGWFPLQILWMDDEHLVVSRINSCASDDVHKRKAIEELVFIGSDGGTQFVPMSHTIGLSRGPAGTVLVAHA